jgi:hypothetical protein
MSAGFPSWLWTVLEQGRSGYADRTAEEEEEEMSEQQYVNRYRCPRCGDEWADVWSCCCNDRCPKCGLKDIEPYKSEDVVHTKRRKRRSTAKRKKS